MRRVWILILVCVLCASHAQAAEKAVALTFDDGPNGAVTEALLDTLAARGVRATFFLCGCNLEKDPDTAAKIVRAGHEIGLHGYSHRDMSKMCRAKQQLELDRAQALVTALCGAPARLLRPPGGNGNDALSSLAAQRQLSLILWSVDPTDWKPQAKAAQIADSILSQVQPGGIILMHDLHLESVEAAGIVIDKLLADGYEICTVSQLAGFYGTKLLPGQSYRRFSFYEE